MYALINWIINLLTRSRTSIPLVLAITFMAFLTTLALPSKHEAKNSSINEINDSRRQAASVNADHPEEEVHDHKLVHRKAYRMMDVDFAPLEITPTEQDIVRVQVQVVIQRDLGVPMSYLWRLPPHSRLISGDLSGMMENIAVGEPIVLELTVTSLQAVDLIHFEAYFESGGKRFGSSAVLALDPSLHQNLTTISPEENPSENMHF